MTAIDQSAIDLTLVRGAKGNGGRNQAHAFGKDERGTKSFDDLVAQLEQELDEAGAIEADAEGIPAVDAQNGDAEAAGQKSRVRIASFDRALKGEQNAQAGHDKAAGKASPDDVLSLRKTSPSRHASADDATNAAAENAADELDDLLSLVAPAQNTVDEPAARKGTKATKAEPDTGATVEPDKPDRAENVITDALKAITVDAGNAAAAAMPAKTVADETASEEGGKNSVMLVSADGKGRPVEIALPDEKGDDAAAVNKTEQVTVLDARRYLGFEVQSNSGALTRAIKDSTALTEAMRTAQSVQQAGGTATAVNTLKLQMNPEHLGTMTASLRLKGEELSVEVRVETVEAYRQLSSDQDGIVKALKDQGFSIDQVTIQLVATDKSADTGQDRGGQTPGGQDLRDSQGQNARQREENARRTGNQSEWQGNEQISSQADAGNSSDDGSTGNLYL